MAQLPATTHTPATPDRFTLPGDIPDHSDAVAGGLTSPTPGPSPEGEGGYGVPTQDWLARGLRHPAGRGWEGEGAPGAGSRPAHGVPALDEEPEEARGLFDRARQVAFLRALAACGAVRRASAHAGVSYRTAYRERRASPAFRRAWDAALLAARALSEDVLACRALDGVEEKVFYRGEEVGSRIRYDTRLLLAHLARLDKLTGDARLRAFADDYEGAMERFAAGIDDPAPVCDHCGEALPLVASASANAPDGAGAGAGAFFTPGQCDRCDTAPAPAAAEPPPPANPCPDCGGHCSDPHARLTQADCQWLGNRLARMEAARPYGARDPYELARGGLSNWDAEDVEAMQLMAFEDGIADWWLLVPPDDDEEEGAGARAAEAQCFAQA